MLKGEIKSGDKVVVDYKDEKLVFLVKAEDKSETDNSENNSEQK